MNDKKTPPYLDYPRPEREILVFPVTQDLNNHELVPAMKRNLESARALWAAADEHRGRREATLSALLRGRNRNKTVLVMTLNRAFTDLLLNWVESCDRNRIEVRSWTLIVALDQQTATLFEQKGFAVYFDDRSYGQPGGEAAAEYGDATFQRIMFPKTAIVMDLLNIGYDVLFQDVDLVWFRDPLPYLLDPSRAGLEAQFMYDGPNIYYQPLHANTGFFHLRNTPGTRKMWRRVYDNFDKVFYLASQQRVVNAVLLEQFFRGLQLDVLPEDIYANGHMFHIESIDTLPPDPAVVHVSWTADLEHKMKKYRMAGLWYL